MGARWKTYDPLHQFAHLAANRAANNAVEMTAVIDAIKSTSRFDVANETYLSKNYRIKPLTAA